MHTWDCAASSNWHVTMLLLAVICRLVKLRGQQGATNSITACSIAGLWQNKLEI
jgi:hypothetical protein